MQGCSPIASERQLCQPETAQKRERGLGSVRVRTCPPCVLLKPKLLSQPLLLLCPHPLKKMLGKLEMNFPMHLTSK